MRSSHFRREKMNITFDGESFNVSEFYYNLLFLVDLLLAGVGLVGNLIMVSLFIIIPRIRNIHGVKFIMSVNASSVLCLLLVCFKQELKHDQEVLCSVQLWLHYFTTFANIYSRVFAGLDRYIYISKGLKYHSIMTDLVSNICLFCLWLTAVSFSMVLSFYKLDSKHGDVCVTNSFGLYTKLIALMFIYEVPTLLISVVYFIIFHWAYTQIREIKSIEVTMENLLNTEDSQEAVHTSRSTASVHFKEPMEVPEKEDDGEVKVEHLEKLYRRLSRGVLVINPDEIQTLRSSFRKTNPLQSAVQKVGNSMTRVLSHRSLINKDASTSSSLPSTSQRPPSPTSQTPPSPPHTQLPAHKTTNIEDAPDSNEADKEKNQQDSNKRVSFQMDGMTPKPYVASLASSSVSDDPKPSSSEKQIPSSLAVPIKESSIVWKPSLYDTYKETNRSKSKPSFLEIKKRTSSTTHSRPLMVKRLRSFFMTKRHESGTGVQKRSLSSSSSGSSSFFFKGNNSVAGDNRRSVLLGPRPSFVVKMGRTFQDYMRGTWLSMSKSSISSGRITKNKYCYRVSKLILVIIFIVTCNAALWLPLCLVKTFGYATGRSPGYYVIKIMYTLGSLTSVLDPVVFGYMNIPFRSAVTRKWSDSVLGGSTFNMCTQTMSRI